MSAGRGTGRAFARHPLVWRSVPAPEAMWRVCMGAPAGWKHWPAHSHEQAMLSVP